MYFDKLFDMTYDEYVDSLLKTYGPVEEPYYTDSSFYEKNKNIVRTDEGLVIHHIDEDKILDLSSIEDGIEDQEDYFKYQLPERLVYCNYVEHMILHMKIVEKELLKQVSERNNSKPVGIGGFVILVAEINRMLDYKFNYLPLPSTCPNWKIKIAWEFDEWWATVFVETIKWFVEKVENLPEFIEWYGPKVETSFGTSLDELLDITNRIYTANNANFGHVAKYCSIKKEFINYSGDDAKGTSHT